MSTGRRNGMSDVRSSIHRKFSHVVLATTACALLITGVAMAVYDLSTFKQNLVADLTAQADILGLAAAPALEFDDAQSAQDYLMLLEAKHNVIGAGIYSAKGGLFASYTNGHAKTDFPKIPDLDGYSVEGNTIRFFKRIVAHGEILGTVYIESQYGLFARLLNYLGIVGVVTVLSLLTAVLISRRLQSHVTQPIIDITSVARDVVEKRDFTSRATKSSDDEIGVLVDAFNGMLAEIERRTRILEQSNRDLEKEIGDRKRAEEALRASEDRLRALNSELEGRVASRTAELEAANKDLESFSYSVSHDLRAPIRAIRGFSSLLLEDHGDALDAEARRKLNVVGSEAARMGDLIDDLLAFSRLGRRALEPNEIDMHQLAQSVYEKLTVNDESNRVDFRLGSLPRARGDRGLFEQVWVNLISNAMKFSSKKDAPVVEVGGISEEREHVYFVRDNGAGFDPAYRERLFGVFQRLHHDHEFPGTWRGTRARAQDRDATWGARVGGCRTGARRDVSLHIAEGVVGCRSSSISDILLVEDNQFDAELAMRGLKKNRVANSIVWVKDGAEALDYVFRRNAYADRTDSGPKLILLDLKMPRVSGIEVTKAIKGDDRTKRIPIVIMTSSKEEERHRRQLQPWRQQLYREAARFRVVGRGRAASRVLLAGHQSRLCLMWL